MRILFLGGGRFVGSAKFCRVFSLSGMGVVVLVIAVVLVVVLVIIVVVLVIFTMGYGNVRRFHSCSTFRNFSIIYPIFI